MLAGLEPMTSLQDGIILKNIFIFCINSIEKCDFRELHSQKLYTKLFLRINQYTMQYFPRFSGLSNLMSVS